MFATVYHSDGSAASVQALHSTAASGDTVTIPPGTFTWSTSVKIWKAIKLSGTGSGRIIGNTKSVVSVSTGVKVFTTTRSGLPITVGQILSIAKMPHPPGGGGVESNPPARGTYMEGTVTSYSDTTLVVNITRTAGSGTWKFWWIATQPATTIINNYNNGGSNNNTPLIAVDQNQAGSAEISGIRFVANPSSNSAFIGLGTSTYIVPKTLIHDCWFETGDGSRACAIFAASNQGLVWNCSFDDTFSQIALGFHFDWNYGVGNNSWSTNSTMGAADINGRTNFYVEDCDFHAYLNAVDFDGNSRVVWRHNVMDNSGMGSHGADSSPVGLRHIEIYDNELIFDNFGDCDGSLTLPVPWFFWMRGGTGVITDNLLPVISSCAWANKGNILFSVLNTRRNTGGYPCWKTYPAPHQVGQSYGAGAVLHRHYGRPTYGQLNYYTYLEPVYIWNNTGTAGNGAGLNAESADSCGSNQQLTDYIQLGRDYKLEAKPGYAKYTYPHPLRSSESRPMPTHSVKLSSLDHVQKRAGKWGTKKNTRVQISRASKCLNPHENGGD